MQSDPGKVRNLEVGKEELRRIGSIRPISRLGNWLQTRSYGFGE